MDAPVTDQEFAERMAPFAPFEATPRLAVGVSGGPDSLALTLLAARWAARSGGSVVALTVDHGLRREAAAEAAQVGEWLRARAVAHRILAWAGPKPQRGVQAAARAARRDLLTAYCRREGILHLLLAHHEDDQAETLVMRLAAGSGPDGLAGMAAVAESADLRVLRPLLAVARARLAMTLVALGQPWIEDPGNRDPRFSRSRVRALVEAPHKVAAPAAGFAQERAGRDAELAALLAENVSIYPEGWATLAPAALSGVSPDLGRRMLARVLMSVGGQAYPPGGARLDRLDAAVRTGALGGGRTVAGCRVVPRKHVHIIAREIASVAGPLPVAEEGTYQWDGRFRLDIAGAAIPPGTVIRALGEVGWRDIAESAKPLRTLSVPPFVRPALPALCDLEGVLEVPHLSYRRKGVDPDSVKVVSAVFRPRHVLAGAGFAGLSPDRGERGGNKTMANRRVDQAYVPSGDVLDGR